MKRKGVKPKNGKGLRNIKNLKRVFYKGRITKFKRTVFAMILVGLVAALAYFGRYVYLEYAVSRADIVLSYPEIAQSKYPDNSRFTYYGFISDDNINDAIKIMQKDGKYKYFTAEDLRNCFVIYSNLESPANASVASARSEGNDFSYVANEYKITYVQPHDYKNPNIFAKFLSPDYSAEFLSALVEVNHGYISDELGGIDGFEKMTETSNMENYDYKEELNVYKTKIKNICDYLLYLHNKEPDFKSESGMSLEDLRGQYDFLVSNTLDGISDYVESSGISKDVALTKNKLRVNIENNQLQFDKYTDRSAINKFAMDEYDHTFSENLINVIQSEQYGLYQARPKTEFDTVVEQKHEADKNVAEYGSTVSQYNRELAVYDTVQHTADENKRLTDKCNSLMENFRAAYDELSQTANDIVNEYYTSVNEEYITAKITRKGLISRALIMNMGLVFAVAAALAFAVSIFISFMDDNRKLRQKSMLMQEIKREEAKEE